MYPPAPQNFLSHLTSALGCISEQGNAVEPT